MPRYGMTIPLDGPLHSQRTQIEELAELGYTDVWTSEVMAHDAFTPLVLAGQWAPNMRLGTAIVPVYTRGPALIAQSIASLADSAPGRVAVGLGTSSNVIVESWNAIEFAKPYQRARDTLRFLRSALAGEKVTESYETFSVRGFRLGVRLEEPVPLLLAALREGMLRLAGSEADGAIVNWLSPQDAARVSGIVNEFGPDKEIAARIFVMPTDNREVVLGTARFAMAAYLNVPVYRAFHEWMGRTDALGGHWERWEAGDRKGALAEIPESVVDDLIVSGTPEQCRARVQEYFANGITTAALAVIAPEGMTGIEAARLLAPGSP